MEIIAIRALTDNYIWALKDAQTGKVVVIDPGESEPVLAMLNEHGCTLAGILITHHHGDHTNGLEALLAHAGEIPVFGSHLSLNPFINHHVKDNEVIHCAHVRCRTMAIPGHTLDHTAYYSEQDNLVFTGDTLFSAGCGRIFEGTPEMMFTSLAKLAALNSGTRVYCGHEYTRANLGFAAAVEPQNKTVKDKLSSLPEGCTLPSSIGEEKNFNPFLRYAETEVIQAAEHYAGKKLDDPVAVFAVLREWKNNFTA